MGNTSCYRSDRGRRSAGYLVGDPTTGQACEGSNAVHRREEWFRRLQWAEELAATNNDGRRATGRAILTELTGSRMATDEDVRLIRAVTDFSDVVSAAAGVAAADSVEALDPQSHPYQRVLGDF